MAPIKKSKKSKPVEKVSNEDEKVAAVSGQLEKKIKRSQKNRRPERGVLFIKHLPRGFYEEQMQKYFEQFGRVTRLRLVRSRRTGNSKGFAFVEFEIPEVAQIAAETMDNYLMFQKVIKASYIPPEAQVYNYFRTSVRKITNKAGKEMYVSRKTAAIQRQMNRHNDWSDENYEKRTQSQLKKFKAISEKYADLGIDVSKIMLGPKKLSDLKSDENETTKDADTKLSKKEKKPSKDIVTLEDLLGDTIADDSEDSDFDLGEGDTSDEETYGITKSAGSDEDDEATHKISNLAKKLKMDTFDLLTKREPLVGGIKKLGRAKAAKKPEKTTNKSKKSTLQVAAAKEIAKPLSAFKTKSKPKNKAGK